MKRSIFAVIGLGALVWLGFYINAPATRPKLPTEPQVETIPVPANNESQMVEPVAAQIEPAAKLAETPTVSEPGLRSVATAPGNNLDGSLASRAVDLLISSQASYQQKRETWKQLRESGGLDQAIAELEQRMTNQPGAAEYPATLGYAYLQKCGISQDIREQGILAMQADKLFDSALGLDQSNWEARFMKAVAMSYWPPMLNKGEEVIEQFQTLIQQQEAQTAQPHFAEPYAWLGDQYQKAGRTNDARVVWERGAVLFPADEKLRTKLAPAGKR